MFVQKRPLEELEQIVVCSAWFGPELYISPQNEPWFVKLTVCCDFQIQTNLCKFLPDRVNKKIYTCRGESRTLLAVLSVLVEIRDGFYLLCYIQPATARTASSVRIVVVVVFGCSVCFFFSFYENNGMEKETPTRTAADTGLGSLFF